MKPFDKLLFLSALLVGLLAGLGVQTPSRAADAVSRKIFVNGTNDSPSWMVRVEVDRSDRVYKVGDQLKVKVVSEQDGYLYLFNVDPDGEIECLFPNNFQTQNQIKAKQEVEIGTGAKFVLRVGDPVGKDLLKAIVTQEPLKSGKLDELIDSKNARPRAINARLAKSIVVEAITGDPSLGNSPESVDKIKEKFQQDNPEKFKARARDYAEHQIEISTVAAVPGGKAEEKRVALIIGIDKFKDQSIRSLAVSQMDARAMESTLRDQGKFKTYTLINKDATKSNIAQYIAKVAQETGPGDTVLLFWSGHGGRTANTDGKSPDGFDEFLVPYDGSLDSDSAVRKTMLFDNEFGRWVQELDGRKVMVVLDTCHSGGHTAVAKSTKSVTLTDKSRKFVKGIGEVGVGEKDKPRNFFFNAMVRAKSIGQKDAAVLASSSAKQVSFERREKDMSVMTYYMVDLLRQSDHSVTLKDVYDGIKDKVNAYVVDKFEGASQTPMFSDQNVPAPAQVRP